MKIQVENNYHLTATEKRVVKEILTLYTNNEVNYLNRWVEFGRKKYNLAPIHEPNLIGTNRFLLKTYNSHADKVDEKIKPYFAKFVVYWD